MRKEFDLKKTLIFVFSRMLVLLLMFYLIYPQALAVGGSSFISGAGVVGILLYAFHRFPFRKEMFSVLFVLGIYMFICFNSARVNNMNDPFFMSYLKSQMGWFFTAYIVIFLMFRVHKKPSVNLLISYIIAVVVLQSILTLLIYFNRDIADFLFSLQLQSDFDAETRARVESERLIGYGTVFFGAGIVAGYGLIFIMYLVVKVKQKTSGLIILSLSYALIFYVGVFSARTTLIGAGSSIVLFLVLFFIDKNPVKKQSYKVLAIIAGLMFVGASLCFIYFPEFTNWAFEVFYNYAGSGQVQTQSSNGLLFLIYGPEDFKTYIFGTGSFVFFGPDVGYTRLMFYIGLPGTIMYFFYSFYVAKQAKTKDWTLNFLLLVLLVYNLIMNIKGFADLNTIFYLFFFYFMFYKYYYFYPVAYPRQSINLKEHRESITSNTTE